VLSIPCFGDRRIKVVIEFVNEALSSSGTGSVQPLPEPEDGMLLVTGMSGNEAGWAYSRANLAKTVPSSQVGSLNALMNESASARAPLLPWSSL